MAILVLASTIVRVEAGYDFSQAIKCKKMVEEGYYNICSFPDIDCLIDEVINLQK